MLHSVKHFLKRVWWAALAYGIAFKYVFYEFFGKKTGKIKNSNGNAYPRQDGKEAVVTGGSRGIGLEIVNNLLSCGYSVVIGSSSPEASRTALRDSLMKKHPGCTVEVWHLDLASMKSVKDFANHYLLTKSACHLLINNAGIMFVKEERTVDGYEKHLSVNYLGHCLLTHLLLPLLARSSSTGKNSRIVNCTSCIHFVGSKDVTDFQNQKYYSKYKAYIDSKLAQVMFTSSLQACLDKNNINVKVNCVHPGVVDTDLMNSVLLIPRLGSIFFKSAEEGAQTATHAALSPELEHVGGKYLEECRVAAPSKISENRYLRMELWERTWKALQPWLSENGYKFIEVSEK
ncbi:dehydrogenase/reductase SDR family member on chromosome X-like [Argiope bruennichi]|uniref:Dehydrogenase/reductase SDR family member on like protein n=1 Tax=Argiope bruennichi TaxID=94029 RepID=A0A8T0EZ61_ARGBR|nr:dehydrogenase/reductase SDR family member on chromosome X-like [Argiope bruennichi]KAF8783350.1 Dehydrogenase/reductase SDR family member on like protein [Argiope bruennichi]